MNEYREIHTDLKFTSGSQPSPPPAPPTLHLQQFTPVAQSPKYLTGRPLVLPTHQCSTTHTITSQIYSHRYSEQQHGLLRLSSIHAQTLCPLSGHYLRSWVFLMLVSSNSHSPPYSLSVYMCMYLTHTHEHRNTLTQEIVRTRVLEDGRICCSNQAQGLATQPCCLAAVYMHQVLFNPFIPYFPMLITLVHLDLFLVPLESLPLNTP